MYRSAPLVLLLVLVVPLASAQAIDPDRYGPVPRRAGDTQVDSLLAYAGTALVSPAVGRACDFATQTDGCTAGQAAWYTIGLASIGSDVLQWPTPYAGPLTFLRADAAALIEASANPTMSAALIAVAVRSAGFDPSSFGLADGSSVDLIARVADTFSDGQFGNPQWINDDIWAAAALHGRSEHVELVAQAYSFVAVHQADDGGIAWHVEAQPDVDTTAWAVAAFSDAASPTLVQRGLEYLHGAQVGQGPGAGCWPQRPGSPANALSTAAGLQALVATREDPAKWSVAGRDPQACLLSLQRANGRFVVSPGTPMIAPSYQVMAGLGWAPYGHLSAPANETVIVLGVDGDDHRMVDFQTGTLIRSSAGLSPKVQYDAQVGGDQLFYGFDPARPAWRVAVLFDVDAGLQATGAVLAAVAALAALWGWRLLRPRRP